MDNKQNRRTYQEPARGVPIVEHSDVVVCGAGPAGVAAAIAAAKCGARTMLLEVNGCLGGVWTAATCTQQNHLDLAITESKSGQQAYI